MARHKMRFIDKDEFLNRWITAEMIVEAPTVEAIPIEWIKKWCNTQNGKSLEERLLKRYGVLTLLEDWEKENEDGGLLNG